MIKWERESGEGINYDEWEEFWVVVPQSDEQRMKLQTCSSI